MNADETDEELIRMAFRVLDKKGSGNISSKEFKLLMTNIGDKLSEREVSPDIQSAEKMNCNDIGVSCCCC